LYEVSDGLVRADDFIIYSDKFEYDVEERDCEPFIPLKDLYLKLF